VSSRRLCASAARASSHALLIDNDIDTPGTKLMFGVERIDGCRPRQSPLQRTTPGAIAA
jgi:hypothetical protein